MIYSCVVEIGGMNIIAIAGYVKIVFLDEWNIHNDAS